MTIVSSREFAANQDKFLSMAVNQDVYIKNKQYIFHLLCQPFDAVDTQVALQPDDDFRRAITKDELLKGIYEDISKRFIEQ